MSSFRGSLQISKSELYQIIADNLIKGDAEKVIKLIGQGLDSGEKPSELLEQGLLSGMNVIGKRFKAGEIFIPEVLLAAQAMKVGMHLIEPLLPESDASPRGTLVIGTVQSDLHDIGKNLASIMFRGTGFSVIDLGVDVSADKFLQAAKEHNPAVIGLSVLLTTTMVKPARCCRWLHMPPAYIT